jgi:phage terminase large subunit GpA-like protein
MTIHIVNAERLAMEAAAAAIKPPPPVDYLAWAERNIVFTERESQFPGPYNRDLFRYFDEPLRALSPDDPCRIVTVMGSAQVGKTVIGNVFTLGSVHMDPGDFLVIHPTDDNARRWSKMKLTPMLRNTTALSPLFSVKSRDGSDSVLYKERTDGLGAILISGANSPASLSQVTVRRQSQDDLSKWEVNDAGDPEAQADNRSRGVVFAKILKISTPLVMPGCRITKNYEAGSQERPYVPCPSCKYKQVLEWENMLEHLDPAKPEDAHFTCVSCGVEIREHHRKQLLSGLEWRAENPGAKRWHRSFWIWSAYSFLQTWEQIAREWFKSKGDADAEKTFANDTTGKAYRGASESPPWEKLRDRASASDYARGQIPQGAILLFMGLDCQIDRVEWQLVGFGRDRRTFVVDYGIEPGHITDEKCQERLLARLNIQRWKNSYGQPLGVDLAAIDGNAWTEDVWEFAKKVPMSKLIMVRGRGEDAAPRLMRVKKERNTRTGKLLRYAKRFYNFNTSILKMALYRNATNEDREKRGFVGFPRGLEDTYFQQLAAERRVMVKRHGFLVPRWEIDPGQANEALDTYCQAWAAATKFGVIDMPEAVWDRYEGEREVAPKEVQGDLEDLLHRPAAAKPDAKPDKNPAKATPFASLSKLNQ